MSCLWDFCEHCRWEDRRLAHNAESMVDWNIAASRSTKRAVPRLVESISAQGKLLSISQKMSFSCWDDTWTNLWFLTNKLKTTNKNFWTCPQKILWLKKTAVGIYKGSTFVTSGVVKVGGRSNEIWAARCTKSLSEPTATEKDGWFCASWMI